ncbi:MAG: septum formation protein Maf [Bacteroidetes bacterium]|nr:septum formation protein Maf [Bacteroidota bacterium]
MQSRSLPPLLLASQSPRRRQLLADAGFTFEVCSADIDETWPEGYSLEEVPRYLAGCKAQALAERSQTHLLITADTTVLLDTAILNKPADEAEAIAMLQSLSGRWHTVISGVQLTYRGHIRGFSEHTRVHFRQLAPREIEEYVQTAKPLDKAGSYGIQDSIGLLGIDRIEGDYYNVMGLPVCRLAQELVSFRL